MLKGLHKAFVYGTLKRGLANHWLLTSGNHGRARFLGEAKLTEKYPLVVGGKFGVPFLLAARGKGKEVQGELYEVDDELLARLDELEHHPAWYTRTPVQCTLTPAGEDVSSEQLITDCEVYLLHDFKPELLSLPHFSCYTREEQDKFYVYSETRDTDEHFDFIGEVKMKEL